MELIVQSNVARGHIAVLSCHLPTSAAVRRGVRIGRLPLAGTSRPQKCPFPTWVSPQTASRSFQPFSHRSPVWQTHRHTQEHTDHATCDICSNRPHIMQLRTYDAS